MLTAVFPSFVICDSLVRSTIGRGKYDLNGAGVTKIYSAAEFPIKQDFWVYVELRDHVPKGVLQFSLMRADSGIRYPFREINVKLPDPVETLHIGTRIFDCVFPEPGVYLLQLWYNREWIVDQRIEVVRNSECNDE